MISGDTAFFALVDRARASDPGIGVAETGASEFSTEGRKRFELGGDVAPPSCTESEAIDEGVL